MKKIGLFFMLFLTTLLGFATPPLANEVFQLTAKPLDPNTFMLHWHVKKGYFLYQKRIRLTQPPNSNVFLGAIHFPEGIKQSDALNKDYFVYRDQLNISIPVLGKEAGESLVNVHYQGCADDGFCYPPQIMRVKLTIDDHLALTQVTIENEDLSAVNSTNEEPNELEQLFASGNWFLIVLSFFGFGLLLAFTPCVLPMVPVLSGIIVGHGEELTTRKAFMLSLSYVLSMSFTYAAVGAVVALMGNNLQIAMQSPWAISIFSLVFILLALSMFNVYELRLPLSWQAKFASLTRRQGSGHYLGAAVMGALSTLILSPCVTAPLIGALGYIAQTGNVSLGVLALFFLGLGMGTPLLLIGTSAGKLLPKAGPWMNKVKVFFGVLLLGVAIYLMGRLLPATLIMGLWASLLIFSGLYMDALIIGRSKSEKFRQGLGIILLTYGVLVLIGASQGHSNPLEPLVRSNTITPLQDSNEIVVNTLADAQSSITKAKGKPILIDFYADWCTACKIMAKTTLQDEGVKTALNGFLVLKVDVTKNNTQSKLLLNYFNVVAPPTFIFYDAEGHELPILRIVGEASAATFTSRLNKTKGT